MTPRTRSTKRRAVRRNPRTSLRRGGIAAVALVTAVLLAMIVVKLTATNTVTAPSIANLPRSPLAPLVEMIVTDVPRTTLDAVGTPSGLLAPQKIQGSHDVLMTGGKPTVVYVGAEYCPFCATEMWPLVVALSKFGTFSGLRATHSGSSDIYPNTATMSFFGSKYSSSYINFSSVELDSNQVVGKSYRPLQSLTAAEATLLQTFDIPPYTTSAGSIPFIDFGNHFLDTGASYNPQILQGRTVGEIANALADPTSSIAMGADGTANFMMAAICTITHNQPTSVCADEAVISAMHKLG